MTPTPFTDDDALALLDHALEQRTAMAEELARLNFSPAFVAHVAACDPTQWLDRTERQKIADLGKPILYGELPPEEYGAQAASEEAYREYLAASYSL